MKELVILMPCLNEEKTIKTCIDKAIKFLKTNNIDGEVLIADNGSTDRSVEIIKKTEAKIVHVKKKGYGNALICGIKNAKSKYVIMCDSDDSYDIENMMPLLEILRENNDLVIGNRYKGGFEQGAMSLSHYIGVKVLTYFANIIHGTKIGDYHCGLRGFDRKKIYDLKLNCSGMEFASEMIIKAKKANYKIVEVPTRLFKDGRNTKSHLNTFRDGFRHLLLIIKLVKYK